MGPDDPAYYSGGLLYTLLIIKKTLHKWQKLGTLVHGNLLFLDSVVSLVQYRRFPLLCPNLCPYSRIPPRQIRTYVLSSLPMNAPITGFDCEKPCPASGKPGAG
jgi:hypothetical protein